MSTATPSATAAAAPTLDIATAEKESTSSTPPGATSPTSHIYTKDQLAASDTSSTNPTTGPAEEGHEEDDELERALSEELNKTEGDNMPANTADSDAATKVAAAARVKLPPAPKSRRKKKKDQVETAEQKQQREKLEADQDLLFKAHAASARQRRSMSAAAVTTARVEMDQGDGEIITIEDDDDDGGDDFDGLFHESRNDADVNAASTHKPGDDVQDTPSTGAVSSATTARDLPGTPGESWNVPDQLPGQQYSHPSLDDATKPQGEGAATTSRTKTKRPEAAKSQTVGLALPRSAKRQDPPVQPVLKIASEAATRDFKSMIDVAENGVAITADAIITEYAGVDGVSQGLGEAQMGFENLKMKVVKYTNGGIDIIISGSNLPLTNAVHGPSAGRVPSTPDAPSKKRKHDTPAESLSKRMGQMQESQNASSVGTPTPHGFDRFSGAEGEHTIAQSPQVPATPPSVGKRKRGGDGGVDVEEEMGFHHDTPQMKKHCLGPSPDIGVTGLHGNGVLHDAAGDINQNAPIDLTTPTSDNDTMPPPPRPVKPAVSRQGGTGAGIKPAIGMSMTLLEKPTEEEFVEGSFNAGQGPQYNNLGDSHQYAGNTDYYAGGQCDNPHPPPQRQSSGPSNTAWPRQVWDPESVSYFKSGNLRH